VRACVRACVCVVCVCVVYMYSRLRMSYVRLLFYSCILAVTNHLELAYSLLHLSSFANTSAGLTLLSGSEEVSKHVLAKRL